MAQKKTTAVAKKAAPAAKKGTVVAHKDQPMEARPGEGGAKKTEPIVDLGPNAEYPFGIKFAKGGFERFKKASIRESRFGMVSKGEKCERVDYKPAAAAAPPAPKMEDLTPPAPASAIKVEAPVAAKGPSLVPGKKKGSTPAAAPPAGNVESISKRITPGAEIKEWRIARSVRVGKPGFFLQGGHHEKKGDVQKFIVGAEEHFTDLNKAKKALVDKLPPSDEAAPAVKAAK